MGRSRDIYVRPAGYVPICARIAPVSPHPVRFPCMFGGWSQMFTRSRRTPPNTPPGGHRTLVLLDAVIKKRELRYLRRVRVVRSLSPVIRIVFGVNASVSATAAAMVVNVVL